MTVGSQGIRDGIETARTFIQEAWAELRRVQWPSFKEVRAATLVVILAVAFVAVLLFIVDSFLFRVLQALLGS